VRLRNDPALCEQMARAAQAACEQFYDESHSWGTFLRQALMNDAVAMAAAADASPAPVTAAAISGDEKPAAVAPARAARRIARGRGLPTSAAAAAAARFSSYGGMVVAAALGVLAALLGFVGISRDHPVPLDGGTRPVPRHLHWADAENEKSLDKPIAQTPSSKTAQVDEAAE